MKETADIFAKHTGKTPNLKQLGTQAELREKMNEAKEKGETGFTSLML